MKNLKSLLTAITIASVMTILPQTGVASPLAKTTGLQKSEAISDLVETWLIENGAVTVATAIAVSATVTVVMDTVSAIAVMVMASAIAVMVMVIAVTVTVSAIAVSVAVIGRNYGYGNRQYYSGNCGFRYSDHSNCRPFFGRRYGSGLGY